MSYAQGLASSLRHLPAVVGNIKDEMKEQKISAGLADLNKDFAAREAESKDDFMGPPRPPVGKHDPSRSARDQVQMSPDQYWQRAGSVYAEHGRPDSALNLVGQGLQAKERAETRDYTRGRQRVADERAEESHEWRRSEQERARALENGQRAFRALQSGDDELAQSIFADNADYLGRSLGLGADRKVVGFQRNGDRIALTIRNSATDSEGPMTERGSADPDDRVMSIGIDDFGRMVGVEPQETYGEVQTSQDLGVGQFGPDGKWHSIVAPKDMSGGAGGRPAAIDSTEAKRMFGRVRTGAQDIFRTHLGSEFMGDPENAQLQAVASDTAYSIMDAAYQEGAQVTPERIGNLSAQIALSPEFEGLKYESAKKLAQEEQQKLPWLQRDEFDVEGRALEIQNDLVRRHQQAVRQAVMQGEQQQGRGQGGSGGAQPQSQRASSGRQSGRTGLAPGGGVLRSEYVPQQSDANTRGAREGAQQPRQQQQAPAGPPRIDGPSVSERLQQERSNGAVQAGRAVRNYAADQWDTFKADVGRAIPDSVPQNVRRGLDLVNPSPSAMAGRAVGAGSGFVRGAAGAGDAPEVPQPVDQFFQTVRAGNPPTIEQMNAVAEFDEANPGVLTDEERQALMYYARQARGAR